MSTASVFDETDIAQIHSIVYLNNNGFNGPYRLHDLIFICFKFFSRRGFLSSYQTVKNTLEITKLPSSIKQCVLIVRDADPSTGYGHAVAQIVMANDKTRTVNLNSVVDIDNLFKAWFTTIILTEEELQAIAASKEADRMSAEKRVRDREAAAQAIRDMEASEQQAKDAEKLRREEIRKRLEEEEKQDPVLAYESISNCVSAYFAEFNSVYPGFSPAVVHTVKGMRTHTTCSIFPSVPSFFSPVYPDATEIRITNEWVFPDRNGDTPDTVQADVVIVSTRPRENKSSEKVTHSILDEVGVAHLQRVSDLKRCLVCLFGTDAIALGVIARTKNAFRANEDAAAILAESQSRVAARIAMSQSRVREVVRTAMDGFLKKLKSEISVMPVQIGTPDGGLQDLSIASACVELNLSLNTLIYEGLAQSPPLESIFSQMETAVDRLLKI